MSLWSRIAQTAHDTLRRTFADPVTYRRSGVADQEGVQAIFTEAYQSVELGGDMPVTTTAPAFEFVISSLTTGLPKKNDEIIRDTGDRYQVTDIHLLGDGHALVRTVRMR